MEVSTKLLALYPASYSWNSCWFFCIEYGIIYFHGYGVLGEEWRLVNGVLWFSRIWIWMVISTDPNNIHLAGKLGKDQWKQPLINITFHNVNIICSFLFNHIYFKGLLDILGASNTSLAYFLHKHSQTSSYV